MALTSTFSFPPELQAILDEANRIECIAYYLCWLLRKYRLPPNYSNNVLVLRKNGNIQPAIIDFDDYKQREDLFVGRLKMRNNKPPMWREYRHNFGDADLHKFVRVDGIIEINMDWSIKLIEQFEEAYPEAKNLYELEPLRP